MTQEIWTMSAREIDRLAILERVESAGLRLDQAPRLAACRTGGGRGA